MLSRFKLEIEYDGTDFCGFQKQVPEDEVTIQNSLEEAIFKLSQERVKVVPSGRTDSGVHAINQVVHFDIVRNFSPYQVKMGLNQILTANNHAISILKAEIVSFNFHARFSALVRHYRYIIINRKAPVILDKNRCWHVKKDLNFELMKEASEKFIGYKDFSSFRDKQCQALSPIKTVYNLSVNKEGEKIIIDISAKSFLHHMVRNIVGTLALVGEGKISLEEIDKIFEAKDRNKSGPNAPACGLYFVRTDYLA